MPLTIWFYLHTPFDHPVS